MHSLTKPEETVEAIFRLYEQYGSEDYIGEKVSQIEHMTQAAALAEAAGYDDEVILSAFFHDIGHLCEQEMEVERMEQYGVVNHENIGYDYLIQKGFSETIAKLVKSHVAAKRYLAFKEPAYYNILSEASKQTLAHQGGKMTEAEALEFEADPLHSLYVQLRRWDDEAKEQNIPVPSLNKYKAMAIAHLQNK
ncbi:MAG: phosphohydrolase [Chitinophaga sp.]|nr:phosphohydrolase [Chitinophaga sp.]